MSCKPTTMRFPDEIMELLNKFASEIENSNLQMKNSKQHRPSYSDIVVMFMNRILEKGSNEVFLMILENLESPNHVDTYTVRGLASRITSSDVNPSEFEAALRSVEAAECQ